MKFSSINPSLGSSYKMTNENVRFFSHFILGTYLVDIKLITSHFFTYFYPHKHTYACTFQDHKYT